jgi:hypothetical protein
VCNEHELGTNREEYVRIIARKALAMLSPRPPAGLPLTPRPKIGRLSRRLASSIASGSRATLDGVILTSRPARRRHVGGPH